MKYHIIPNLEKLDLYQALAKEYNLGFEYNDFFYPNLLDDSDRVVEVVLKYKSLGRKNDTLHGAFFDIVFDSSDNKIKEVSYLRARQSLRVASMLECKGVIFHTNYITWMKDEAYKKRWVEKNKEAYLTFLTEFKDLEIYVENMFDLDPYLLRDLIKEINHERIGVCLDIAHANLSNVDIEEWFNVLGKYIKHIHINDNLGDIDSHMELGLGNIDYKRVFELINKLPNKPTILIEISDYNKTVNSISYIKNHKLDKEL